LRVLEMTSREGTRKSSAAVPTATKITPSQKN
jgi:hypothetical protein